MSDWNHLVTQLRSWTPRRPSPDLRKKIFSSAGTILTVAVAQRSVSRCSATWSWLAPTAACCLTLFTLVRGNSFRSMRGEARENHVIFAVAMSSLTASNPTANFPTKWFGLSAADENLEWNVWSKTSFDWTKEGQFLSTNRSVPLAQTNYLMR